MQVSDPFTERKLDGLLRRARRTGFFVALQDLGAAGLTSSSSEMASKGGVGLRIDLDRVPLREAVMLPAEILVSESQERMLAVVEPTASTTVIEICRERFDLDATDIGEVTDGDRLTAAAGGEVVVDIPARYLPRCARVRGPAEPRARATPLDLATVAEARRSGRSVARAARPPTIASKRWVYEQYDQLVGANTIRRPGGDAAVVRLPGTNRAIAVTTDSAERHCQLDPRQGGAAAVFEAARNVACVGGRPAAITNCLNFPNPEKGPPDGAWPGHRRYVRRVPGTRDTRRGGNVSLYNESPRRIIFPTPVVGMVGLLDDAARSVGHAFRRGRVVLLAGAGSPRLDGSEYLGPPRATRRRRTPGSSCSGARRCRW